MYMCLDLKKKLPRCPKLKGGLAETPALASDIRVQSDTAVMDVLMPRVLAR